MTALAVFALNCARARNPLIDASLFKIRAFTGSSVVAIVFSIAFGAMLLSLVLWCQDVWGWTALQTGLAVAPGPLMVPLFAFLVAGRAIARYGPGRVIAAGATIYAAGATWWTLRASLDPNYVGRDAARDADDRHRGGPDAADVHVHRRLGAAAARRSPPARAWSTCCVRWAWPLAWPCSSP